MSFDIVRTALDDFMSELTQPTPQLPSSVLDQLRYARSTIDPVVLQAVRGEDRRIVAGLDEAIGWLEYAASRGTAVDKYALQITLQRFYTPKPVPRTPSA